MPSDRAELTARDTRDTEQSYEALVSLSGKAKILPRALYPERRSQA